MKKTRLSFLRRLAAMAMGLLMPVVASAEPVAAAKTSVASSATVAGISKEKPSDFSVDFPSYDFGTVKQDSPNVVHEFNITNTSSSPILIVGAKASCGCTRPVWTKEPVRPGQTGMVRVTFVPKGQKGYVSKNITVNIVTQGKKKNKVVLKISGTVTP